VTTHWHTDHLVGNAAYRDAFPGVTFVAQAETRRLVLKNDPQYIEQQQKGEALVERVKEALRTGMRKGKPMTDEDRVVLTETLPLLEATLGDTEGVELVAPQLAFEGSLTVDLGGREVKILHLGRGNTAGDAVVYVPDARVLATGDLVVSPTPYGYGSYYGDWITTLERLMALGATTIVPGHGPVEHDLGYERTLVELFTSLRSQVAAAVKEGLTLEQTRKRVDLSSFETALSGGDAARARAFRVSFVTPGVERAYEEAKGPLSDE
jgi:glyoxylase-like metal-dependent hydrolase (beta-lactamase superfamily II)